MTTRLRGRPMSQADALAEYRRRREQWIATRQDVERARILAVFWWPDPEKMHRWRVQLDCGHIDEVFTSGKDQQPQQIRWGELQAGEYHCTVEECAHHEERDIVSWDKLDEYLDPDPEDPPDWWGDELREVWTKTRMTEPQSYWSVTLACGHKDHAIAPPGWKPEDGITRQAESLDDKGKARLAAMRAEIPDDRHLAEGLPRPQPWTHCFNCIRGRKITAQEYVGSLMRPSPPPPPPDKAALQRRLEAAERKSARLRQRLAELD